MTAVHEGLAEVDAGLELQGPEHSAAIHRHLEQILASEFFRNSHRYPNFLRYVVNETLRGRADQLKERTLGIELFEREPDYDTNLDHIVRSTASEVRKRLTLYYHEHEGEHDVRIELPQRSYTPVFHRIAKSQVEESQIVPGSRRRSSVRHQIVYAAIAGISLFLAGAGAEFLIQRPLAKAGAQANAQPPPSLVDVLAPQAGQRLDAVTGDVVLEALNTQIAGNFVSLDDYQNHRILGARYHLTTQQTRNSTLNVVQQAIQAKLQLISRIYQSLNPIPVSVRTPDQMTAQDFQRDNMLLVEGPRADPWVQLFETRMNFRSEVRPDALLAEFRNMAPHAGEKKVYLDVPARGSNPGYFYGHIAYFPATPNHGKVLIMSGPNFSGSYATLCFATDPNALKTIFGKLGVNRLDQLPQFEILLKFTGNSGTDPEARIIAFRRGSEMPSSEQTPASVPLMASDSQVKR